MKFEKPVQDNPSIIIDTESKPQFEAERLAHRRFGVESFWKKYDFNQMIGASIPKVMASYVESLPFFFLATANKQGECDCSFRGREIDATGKAQALLTVLNSTTLVFPDFTGNNFFTSLGNILVNGQVGMLFIDFDAQLRVRINGRANVIEDRQTYASLWPKAQRYVLVEVTQTFGNCQSRIPRMKLMRPYESG